MSRWDKYKRAPWRQDSSATASEGWWQASLGQLQEQLIVGWSQIEKSVIDAVRDYLEKCAQVIRKAESLCGKQKTMVGKSGKRTMRGRRMGETSGTTLGIKEPRQKLRCAPTALYRLLSLSKARRQLEKEEEDHWELREERRKRRIAFKSLAKGMLRYLDNGDGVKVGITELQERLEVPAQIGISIQQVAQQAMNEDGRIVVRNVLARRRIFICGLLDQMGSATERHGLLGKRVSRHKW